jgi:hypothetical protein
MPVAGPLLHQQRLCTTKQEATAISDGERLSSAHHGGELVVGEIDARSGRGR